MQVILLERVEKLGFMGDVVDVKPGYARNFLLPKKRAIRANKANIEYFEKQKSHLEAVNLKRRADAEHVAERMKDVVIHLIRTASETGHLYGSVRNQDIAVALTEAGFHIDRNQVSLAAPIKSLGTYKAKIVLHPEVTPFIDVVVVQSEEAIKTLTEGTGEESEIQPLPEAEES